MSFRVGPLKGKTERRWQTKGHELNRREGRAAAIDASGTFLGSVERGLLRGKKRNRERWTQILIELEWKSAARGQRRSPKYKKNRKRSRK